MSPACIRLTGNSRSRALAAPAKKFTFEEMKELPKKVQKISCFCDCGLPVDQGGSLCQKCALSKNLFQEGYMLKKSHDGRQLKKLWLSLLDRELYCI